MTGICPKCGEYKFLTKHYILPVRNFGRENNDMVIHLCREDHDDLERLIPFEKIDTDRYYEIVVDFLSS